jgi:hypothetical protein
MEIARMNYYFTGALVVLLVLMALFMEPGYIPK